MTTTVVPQPMAVDGVVFNDVGTRTLTVRLPDKASGYERLMWQQGWQALRQAQEKGWYETSMRPLRTPPEVWASTPGHYRVVYGLPGDGGVLTFHFPPGVAAYTELISKPGLIAILTVDRGNHHILSCRFLNRTGV